MGILYGNIVDAINQQTFELRKPASYDPTINIILSRGRVAPIYDPNGTTEDITVMSTKYIIDMIYHEVPFKIVKEEDVETILDLLHTYLQTMEHLKDVSSDSKLFYEKALSAYNLLKGEVEDKNRFLSNARLANAKNNFSLDDMLRRLPL